MATLPPDGGSPAALDEPQQPPRRASHQARDAAESFGADAARYDRTRPGYPQELVDRIVAASPGRAVLDVGCGTGTGARQFRAAGCTVLGVEPDPRMAELARRGGLDVEVTTFEAWEPAGRKFDAAVAGQAWHWIDPVAGPATAARALRPGGRLAVFWNAFQPAPGLTRAFAAVYDRVATGLPFNPYARPPLESYLLMCDRAAAAMAATGTFTGPQRWRSDWERRYSRDEWLEQVPTFGGHGQIAPARLTELLAGLGDAIDAAGGSFVLPYATVAVTAIRI
jgi:SAM-dependent methyltransferase